MNGQTPASDRQADRPAAAVAIPRIRVLILRPTARPPISDAPRPCVHTHSVTPADATPRAPAPIPRPTVWPTPTSDAPRPCVHTCSVAPADAIPRAPASIPRPTARLPAISHAATADDDTPSV